MNIDLIDYKTVKVTLTDQDMDDLCIDYDSMDYNDIATKRAVKAILQAINETLALDLSSNKLFIEAFPNDACDNGCILYISMLEKFKGTTKHELSTPLVFQLQDVDTLTALSQRIFKQYSHLILKSSLYLLDQNYMLLLYTYSRLDKKLSALASEYAPLYGKGEIVGSFIKEHAYPLVPSNALETVVENLC